MAFSPSVSLLTLCPQVLLITERIVEATKCNLGFFDYSF